MPSSSRSQQRLFGMVHACQKYNKCSSSKIKKLAGQISPSDADEFASTKHEDLPEKKESFFPTFRQWLSSHISEA